MEQRFEESAEISKVSIVDLWQSGVEQPGHMFGDGRCSVQSTNLDASV